MFVHIHIPHKPTWGVLLAITVVALHSVALNSSGWFKSWELVRFRWCRDACFSVKNSVLAGYQRLNSPCKRRTEVRPWWPSCPITQPISSLAQVEFHYSAIRGKRFHLEGEDNPLWMILFGMGYSVSALDSLFHIQSRSSLAFGACVGLSY